MRDWTWTSDADCKTPEELEERREWVLERYLRSRAENDAKRAGTKKERKERNKRIRKAKEAGVKVDGDGYEYNEQLEHDHRAGIVRPFDELVVKTDRWEYLCQELWDCVVRINFAFRRNHGRLAKTNELHREVVALKKRRPEFAELPSEIGKVIVWQVSSAFSASLATPNPDAETAVALLERRSTYNFHLTHITVVEVDAESVTFTLPKLGCVTCDIPRRAPRGDYADDEDVHLGEGYSFAEAFLDGRLRIKGACLYKHPTTGVWKLRPSFQRLEQPQPTAASWLSDNQDRVMEAIRRIFARKGALALTGREITAALGHTEGIVISTYQLKAVMAQHELSSERYRRGGKRQRCYFLTQADPEYY
jgi:hypothetical protein